MSNNKKIAVLYHGGCPDGFSGAWAAWKKFGPRADYIPLYDRRRPPRDLKERDLYLIDWTYPAEVMRELVRANRSVVVIDHHEAMRKDMREAAAAIYSSKHSGAVLAWRYFLPNRKMPKLLNYVEDYDLWKMRFRDTEALQVVIDMRDMDFQAWNKLAVEVENSSGRKKLTVLGGQLLIQKSKIVRQLTGIAQPVIFRGYRVMAVNSPVFRNEVGHELAKREPHFSICWWQDPKQVRISFRSAKSFDLLKAFGKMGVAGHPNAAGLIWPLDKPLPWRRVK